MDKKDILIESAKYIMEYCGEHDVCDESCVFCTNHGYAECMFGITPCDWDFETVEDRCKGCLSGGTSVNPKEQKCYEEPKDVLDDRWVEFKNYMEQLHEMQDEGCRGCERPETDCRKCMQDYYWLNIKHYL